ncbi:adenylyltransferase/cytidyltransferase family protein [Candidatus Bathyarchaeota archaeon]|nr:adenylyltransferase/cytidyltransferase family protein [Candidatus Bathyarchaeota archaeon]MBT7187037.1 adenylyltransferase/cytidyltransferase family protein [Candidatus Bathyarchaeota archaeon]MBT7345908.1 adenylyltransferase/cytidyltransferase family protein [Candidatus Bathyarchaeota archaeon]
MTDPKKARVGYADMVADILHWGHVEFLKNCKSMCDYLVIEVPNDKLVAENKRESFIPFEKRKEVVRSIRYVDEVRDSLSWNPSDVMRQLVSEGYNLKYYFHGNDKVDPRPVEYIESVGGEAMITPYVEGISTTYLIEQIMAKRKQSHAKPKKG